MNRDRPASSRSNWPNACLRPSHHHLDAEAEHGKAGNHRNGTSPKTVLTHNGELELDIPRDRQATFEPQRISSRLPGFDDHVISMYARGMSVREIHGHLLQLYGL